MKRHAMHGMDRVSALMGGLLLAFAVAAQRSPFNGLVVPPPDSMGHHRILIGGHFHGESTNRSGFPASTLLARIDTINSLGAHLLLSTGDLFMDPVGDLPRYRSSFFSRLVMPLFNAPGNHDLAAGAASEEPVHGRQEGWAFITLNTERYEGSLRAEDLELLQRTASGMKRLFILSHRPVWAEGDPRYADLFIDNTRSAFGTNFKVDVYPVLERIARHTEVFWVSGSLGGGAPASIFFQRHAPNITYVQCALRDEPRDALLVVDVHPDTVRWSAFSLTGRPMRPVGSFDAAWWRGKRGGGDGINWRLLPYLVKRTVLHRSFAWGAGLMLLVVLLVRRLLRR